MGSLMSITSLLTVSLSNKWKTKPKKEQVGKTYLHVIHRPEFYPPRSIIGKIKAFFVQPL